MKAFQTERLTEEIHKQGLCSSYSLSFWEKTLGWLELILFQATCEMIHETVLEAAVIYDVVSLYSADFNWTDQYRSA